MKRKLTRRELTVMIAVAETAGHYKNAEKLTDLYREAVRSEGV